MKDKWEYDNSLDVIFTKLKTIDVHLILNKIMRGTITSGDIIKLIEEIVSVHNETTRCCGGKCKGGK